jgi:hypothetical protein
MTLPQEFPRDLALLTLAEVLPDLEPGAAEAYRAAFEARRADPLAPRGLVLLGPGGLRPLMALMRLVVLRFRDINLDRFPGEGGEGRLLSAYVVGENLAVPLPARAGALFIERAERAPGDLAQGLADFAGPVFATWEGPAGGPVWQALAGRCDVLQL